jgi:hypothetical protein
MGPLVFCPCVEDSFELYEYEDGTVHGNDHAYDDEGPSCWVYHGEPA